MAKRKKKDILKTVEKMWFTLYGQEVGKAEEKLEQQEFNRQIRILSEGVKIASIKHKVDPGNKGVRGSEFEDEDKEESANGNAIS